MQERRWDSRNGRGTGGEWTGPYACAWRSGVCLFLGLHVFFVFSTADGHVHFVTGV